MNDRRRRSGKPWLAAMILMLCGVATTVLAVPLPGGTLNPTTIPKYATELVIPPVMPKSTVQPAPGKDGGAVPAADYNIAVRQFKQRILPANDVNGNPLYPVPVWSYGLEEENITPDFVAPAAGFSLNYPAFTVENDSNMPTRVRWINDLRSKNADGTYSFLPHILTGTVDQTLHWANPPAVGCIDGTNHTECKTYNPAPYTGPVPIVTHVHGAHVNPESDGYPEAWWLPAADDIPAGYAHQGRLYTQRNGTAVQDFANPADIDPVDGAAFYTYDNSQPATTLWYHDHSLGMTRLNVYAGPAGFWLIRGLYDGGSDLLNGAPAVLPGPAPLPGDSLAGLNTPGDPLRSAVREIPIVIQDRSFDMVDAAGNPVPQGDPAAVGTRLFYPDNRAFFDTFTGPYIDDVNKDSNSDIAPIWNPEAFFNTMVVNGTAWPKLDVAPAKYRFRLLNGSNSRFLNLAMFEVVAPGPDAIMGTADDLLGAELPFYQIGGDQGFLPNVVEIMTGFLTPVDQAIVARLRAEMLASIADLKAELARTQKKLAATTKPKKIAQLKRKIARFQAKIQAKINRFNAKLSKATRKKRPGPDPARALLMGPAERADVIVDFGALAGKTIRMINTADDAPFGGFPNLPADAGTSGQIMQFVVNQPTVMADASTTSPFALALNAEVYDPALSAFGTPLTVKATPRRLSLNEEVSAFVCVDIDAATGDLVKMGDADAAGSCAAYGVNAFLAGPKAALLGTVTTDMLSGMNMSNPLTWSDNISETPDLNSSEFWDIYNLTVDGHPIHMHLVRYKVIQRQLMDTLALTPLGAPTPALPTEAGMKDTVIAYPGEITRIQASFDIPGLYVWHCHIVEHEDNEMMRPYYVGPIPAGFPIQ